MKRALVIGSQGQDGRLLIQQLLAANYSVLGCSKQGCRLEGESAIASSSAAEWSACRILEPESLNRLIREFQPHEIYYLAAFHHSAEARLMATAELFAESYEVHVRGLLHCLEGMVRHLPKSRLFYAASSHTFGSPSQETIDEQTPLDPICIYGITKTAGVQSCRFYRRQHALFASVGFLFNHESPYRRSDFLSQKIVKAAVAIKLGRTEPLILGDLSAIVDWGYAGDYTLAMQAILAAAEADDFVIASGIKRTVADFAATTFACLDLDWRQWVQQSPAISLRKRNPMIGNPARLKTATGWQPSVSFEKMIAEMVSHEAAQRGLDSSRSGG
jgi:GDPmannose 4,6-dehydratase